MVLACIAAFTAVLLSYFGLVKLTALLPYLWYLLVLAIVGLIGSGSRDPNDAPSNILPMRPRPPSENLPREDILVQETTLPSHVPLFVQQRLKRAQGMSLAATELRAVYDAWCTTHGYEPLSPPKFAAELKRLGCDKWKSCGLMRYRDLQLVA